MPSCVGHIYGAITSRPGSYLFGTGRWTISTQCFMSDLPPIRGPVKEGKKGARYLLSLIGTLRRKREGDRPVTGNPIGSKDDVVQRSDVDGCSRWGCLLQHRTDGIPSLYRWMHRMGIVGVLLVDARLGLEVAGLHRLLESLGQAVLEGGENLGRVYRRAFFLTLRLTAEGEENRQYNR